jgi:hypothetical protein
MAKNVQRRLVRRDMQRTEGHVLHARG